MGKFMYQQLILASASPRRREILTQAGIPFQVQVADFDENRVREELAAKESLAGGETAGEPAQAVAQTKDFGGWDGKDYPARYVRALALGKAQAVARKNVNTPGCVVLGADTVVVHRGEILNKPTDREDAKRMLMQLEGDVHAVYTGVALCRTGGSGRAGAKGGSGELEKSGLAGAMENSGGLGCLNFAVRTDVVFGPMEEAEIEEYLACGEYVDKAGAYAIQGRMAAYIREIHGDYYNVMGLPLSAVVQALKKM